MDLENALTEIEAYGADLHDGRLLPFGVTSDDQIRPRDAAQQGPSTPSTPLRVGFGWLGPERWRSAFTESALKSSPAAYGQTVPFSSCGDGPHPEIKRETLRRALRGECLPRPRPPSFASVET
jgi:hypothetical protein